MARRKNTLTFEDVTPQAQPVYAVDDFDSAMDLFLRDGKIRNISPHTLGFYRQELGKFRRILDKQRMPTDPSKITEKTVKENVILYLMDDGQKETSINCVLRAARALFNFLVREGYLTQSPMRKMTLIKQKKTVVATFTPDQLRLLIAQPDQKTFVGVRDRTMIMLFAETGVRVRELTEIKTTDINWRDGVIKIDGKGYKQRLVPFQATMRKELARYLNLRGTLEHDNLFVTIDNTPLTVRQVQEQVAFYGRRAGIKGVRCSPHTLRHTFAKMSVQNGADVFALQAVLGHATLDQVRTYVNLFSNEVRDEHRKFSPLERMY
ncbi:tyrosine-type recombinase/integrase [Paenibacillus sabinae]|uniref:Tyrosine recombinase XerD n=1 Tax=Paenibacillus sabinae T27 TaxID=1268072 RepID=X5A3W9_9BACL|nr:tyrosine-type recombinase/integrase [Paenibacillus sabinae]AHV99013.1 tyrosine recombinase XerD [Paenibacillus sabinae T27]